MHNAKTLTLALTLLSPSIAQEQDTVSLLPGPWGGIGASYQVREDGIAVSYDRPDRFAPLGVLAVHPESEGSWTFTYRYERTDRDGMVEGDRNLSDQDVFDRGFSETPIRQVTERHLFSALYGYDERLSFLMDIPWYSHDMDVSVDGGGTFSTRSIGLGDVQLTGLYSLIREEDEFFHLDLGISLPTGSTDENDQTPTSGGTTVKLPYPMQLGSGTVDLHPGLTYFRLLESTSWGLQARYTYRIDENSDEYALGDSTEVTAWLAREFQDDLSGSLRIAWVHDEPIDGADPALDPGADPAADPLAQGGDRLNFFLGLNYTRPGGHRFAGEIGGPIFQDLNGPQLETDVIYSIAWRFSF